MRRLALLLSLAFLPSPACKRPVGPIADATPPPVPPAEVPAASAGRLEGPAGPGVRLGSPSEQPGGGLVFRLVEGQPATPGGVVPPRPEAAPLSAEESARLLARLPPLPPEAGQRFALREKGPPPPRAGQEVALPFPPPPPDAVHPATEDGPLAVSRFLPEGEVALAPELAVTFSEPMVAVGTVAAVAQAALPLRLEPQPPGDFRWIGTRTLLFRPQGRFPMATDYRVTVPAGVRAASGRALAAERSFRFSTPPPRLVAFHPSGGPVRRDPVLVAVFDQRVDPAAVLATIKLEGAKLSLKLVSAEEAARDPEAAAALAGLEAGRFVAFRAERPLPAAAEVVVHIGPGTPSAEGPRRSAEAEKASFRTYDAFRVSERRCGWSERCRPGEPFTIWFNNPVDPSTFDAATVRVEPALPGLRITTGGNTLSVQGMSKGRTRYLVQLPAGLRDAFGQELGPTDPLDFEVGKAEQELFAPGEELVVLDPASRPALSVYSTNLRQLRVRVHAAAPEMYRAFVAATDERKERGFPGKLLHEGTLAVGGGADERVETRLDLSPWLSSGLGHLVVEVRPVEAELTEDWMRQNPPRVRRFVQATRLGLSAFADGEGLVAWVSELTSGASAGEVELSLSPHGLVARSDSSGLARFTLPERAPSGGGLLVAKRGQDLAFLPESTWDHSGPSSWLRATAPERYVFWVAEDRGMYRPGEEVHLKGYLRRVGAGKLGDLEPLPPAAREVRYQLADARGTSVLSGQARLHGLGGFELVLRLPKTMETGAALLQLALAGKVPGEAAGATHRLEVAEFRRPEFEVSASAGEGPHLVGGRALVTTRAAYYAGGGLPGAEVSWNVQSHAGSFVPPGRSDWSFGRWVPWWLDAAPARGRFFPHPRPGLSGGPGAVLTGRTDAGGEHHLAIELSAVDPPAPSVVRAEATVADVNRQAWSAAAELLVHPAAHYVGLKVERPFFLAGEPVEIAALVVDLEGKARPGREISLRLVRREWRQVKGEWVEAEAEASEQKVRSAEDGVRARFVPKEGGRFELLARITDEQGRPNESSLSLWVAGEKTPGARGLEQESVELVPDRKEYRPGDTARVLVRAPFAPAEGFYSVRRGGLVASGRFRLEEPSGVIVLPIEESWLPEVGLQVDLVGGRPGQQGSPSSPAYASGRITLAVPPMERTLAVSVAPESTRLEPGGSTRVEVQVRDRAGRPVAAAELLVFVVDEAVLALTGYRLPSPVDAFYTARGDDVRDHHTRAWVLREEAIEEGVEGGVVGGVLGGAAPGGRPMFRGKNGHGVPAPTVALSAMERSAAGDGEGSSGGKIALRSDLDPLALFAPGLLTDAAGKASVVVKLKDSLTRYRVYALAASGARQFGVGESTITARKPLMVRPALPRFLNFGDEFELAVLLQNQTAAPLEVTVAARAANAELTSGTGRRVQVPADDRVEVRLPARAARAGRAVFQLAAASGRLADAAELSIPVWTPATTEAFASYGQVDSGAVAERITPPAEVVPGFGGLEISASSTQLQALTDAVIYLTSYPFECSEQLASRLISLAALKDVLNAFEAEGMPGPKEAQAAVERDLARLRGMQNDDGGFAFWRKGEPSWPFNSIHAAHALARAQEKRYPVPADMVQGALRYLRAIESSYPSGYGPEARRVLTAYALFTRQLLDDPDRARARALIAETGGVEKLPLEALGWLYPVLTGDPASQGELTQLRRHLANRTTETAGAAHFVTSYGEGAHLLLHSDRRVDGVLLYGLLGDQPGSDLVPKLVRGLLAHRVRGRWPSTQDNVWVLLALDRYFQRFEKTPPAFVARVWLGGGLAGEHRFRGHNTDTAQIAVPMSVVQGLGADARRLTVQKDGVGRLYYRLGLRYAPASLALAPADQGFVVERRYEAVDDPGDVRRDEAGVWRVRAGARVRVRVSLVAPSRRYHVALVDPLPAGLEPLNPALAVTGSLPADPAAAGPYWWWQRAWYEHENLRDERAEAFTSLLWEGVHEYVYTARATTLGRFVVPPAKAEEMYAPETFGRSGTDRLVVE